MTGKHTQGKLRLSAASPNIFVEDMRPISDSGVHVGSAGGYDGSGFFPSDADGLENARRIVAAWNACQGIPTEVLEAQQSGGLPWSVADQIEARVIQADLLEALQEFVSCRDEARSIDDGVPNSSALAWTALRHRLERLESASRALILKATGEHK